jgi:hypothetical protein
MFQNIGILLTAVDISPLVDQVEHVKVHINYHDHVTTFPLQSYVAEISFEKYMTG